MTSNVTSIARIRTAARVRAERSRSNSRASTVLLLVAVVLVVIGLGETMSASSTVGIDQAADRFHFFKRQLVGVGIGLVAMLVASRVPYRAYRKLALPLYGVTVLSLLAVLVTGTSEGGAQRWLVFGGFNFQPSELAKFSVIVLLALLLERKKRNLETWAHFLIPVGFVVGIVTALLMKQPDLGTTILIGAVALSILWTSPAPGHKVVMLALAGAALALAFSFSAEYRTDRIVGFLDPWSNASSEGYQLIQGYYALGDGGIFGVGLGASRARWFYLPNAHTDFIFAIIGEETGLIGAMTVIALFVILAITGWVVASRAPDLFGKMVAAGITAWLSIQALINVGGVLGVMPITGIALPFVSFGSTALIMSMAALGVLVNISQQGGRG
ncbi:MAG TPA: putative lipid II flippase FtsW [Acidimicrobiia bacterium]|nr:putative lipid II flippase FtsW [Acidimicrobiia bacterium]